jgi:hypothetical protein
LDEMFCLCSGDSILQRDCLSKSPSPHPGPGSVIAKFLRPFLRRFLIVFRPFAVAILARNPDNRKIEVRLLFDNVRFDIINFLFD